MFSKQGVPPQLSRQVSVNSVPTHTWVEKPKQDKKPDFLPSQVHRHTHAVLREDPERKPLSVWFGDRQRRILPGRHRSAHAPPRGWNSTALYPDQARNASLRTRGSCWSPPILREDLPPRDKAGTGTLPPVDVYLSLKAYLNPSQIPTHCQRENSETKQGNVGSSQTGSCSGLGSLRLPFTPSSGKSHLRTHEEAAKQGPNYGHSYGRRGPLPRGRTG